MKRGPFPPNLKFDELYSVEISVHPRSPAVQSEILAFWASEQALPDGANAAAREPQVIAIARHRASGAVAALGSVVAVPVKQLNCTLWQFRTFAGVAHRKFELASRLTEITRDYLNVECAKILAAGGAPQALGLYVVFESEILHKTNNFAVLPTTQLVYAGLNPMGQRQYVYFFDGTRVPVRQLAK